MSITQTEVEHIAHLARLHIVAEDLPVYTKNLNNILNFVEQFNALDTQNIDPMSNPLDLIQRLREDIITEIDNRALFQAIAPLVEAGLYLVPQVIEEG